MSMDTIALRHRESFYRQVGPPNEEGCRPWLGYIQPGPRGAGYGRWGYGSSRRGLMGHLMAHRAAFMLAKGDIPDGFHVDHWCHRVAVSEGRCEPGPCRHRACVEPDHLFAEPGEISRSTRDRLADLVPGQYERLLALAPRLTGGG